MKCFGQKQLRLSLWVGVFLIVGLLAACAPITAPQDSPLPAAPTAPVDPDASEIEEPEIEEPEIEEPPTGEPAAEEPMRDDIESNVRAFVAREEGVSPDEVEIVQMEAVDWPDACLGVAEADEMCAMVITPGYRITVSIEGAAAGEEERVYHTNADGTQIRPAAAGVDGDTRDGVQSGTSRDPQLEDEGEAIAMTVRQALMQQLHVDFDAISVASVEATEWPDACLGVPNPVELCAQMITPGYRIVIEVNDTQGSAREYVYHTDETGQTIRLAQAPQAQTGDPIILWSGHGLHQPEEECWEATIGLEGVAFGRCYAVQMQGHLAGEARADDLTHFAETYTPFTVETPAGHVEFRGTGDQAAGPAQQRMIAEWARQTTLEAEAGRSGASWGLAFAWDREGGIAGFCDHLSAYVTGQVAASTCVGETYTTVGERALDEQELAQIYAWIDEYAPFEIEETDPATADAMTIRLVFSGAGQTQADAETQQEIADFAAGLFASLE